MIYKPSEHDHPITRALQIQLGIVLAVVNMELVTIANQIILFANPAPSCQCVYSLRHITV